MYSNSNGSFSWRELYGVMVAKCPNDMLETMKLEWHWVHYSSKCEDNPHTNVENAATYAFMPPRTDILITDVICFILIVVRFRLQEIDNWQSLMCSIAW